MTPRIIRNLIVITLEALGFVSVVAISFELAIVLTGLPGFASGGPTS